MKIKAIIEKAHDGGISIYCEEIKGLYGYGNDEKEAKEDFEAVIEEQAEYYAEKHCVEPEWRACEVEYVYDISGFFEVFPFINASEFAKHVGINPSLMRRYKNRLSFASAKQKSTIQAKYNSLIEKMATVKF